MDGSAWGTGGGASGRVGISTAGVCGLASVARKASPTLLPSTRSCVSRSIMAWRSMGEEKASGRGGTAARLAVPAGCGSARRIGREPVSTRTGSLSTSVLLAAGAGPSSNTTPGSGTRAQPPRKIAAPRPSPPRSNEIFLRRGGDASVKIMAGSCMKMTVAATLSLILMDVASKAVPPDRLSSPIRPKKYVRKELGFCSNQF